jgi:LysM repeat protein
MKIPRLLIRKKKLRATTARRSVAAADEMDYEEMSEPNMKLSRALLIVLVLHVVAVAGIIAFNTIKSRQGAFPPAKASTNPAKAETVQPVTRTIEPTSFENETAALAKAASAPVRPLVKDSPAPESTKIPRALPIGTESGNVYVVAAGDNPVKIAKKLKVSQEELLAVNHIEDPRKLQIGQRLIVPASKKGKGNAGK